MEQNLIHIMYSKTDEYICPNGERLTYQYTRDQRQWYVQKIPLERDKKGKY